MRLSEASSVVRPWDSKPNGAHMSHSLIGADRATHLKIVAVSLVAAIAVVAVGITARVADGGAAAQAVVKAGKPSTYTARTVTVR
jgi:hypothetical protein